MGGVPSPGEGPMARRVALVLAVVWCLGVGAPGRAEDGPQTPIGPADRVLVLHSERADLPAVVRIDRGIRSALTGPGVPTVELFAEYLDVGRFADGRRIERYAESIQYRYAEVKPDVLIAVGAPAVAFLARRGAAMFPGTPVVVTALEARHLRTTPLPAGFTGIVTSIDTRATLELLLGLHPGTRRIAIAAGAAPLDRHWAEETRRVATALAPAVEVVDLGGLAMPAMLEAVAAQPPHTVIFYVHVLSDAAGRRFAPTEALAAIARVAKAPIYGTYDTYIGQGAVGGRVVRLERLGTRAGEIAARILGGARAEDIPVETGESNVFMFDARQLRRFGIAESRLPAGSTVLFREPSVWALYRGYILAGCAVLALQTAFIAGLLVQRGRRRRAESALAERLRFEVLLSELSTTFLTAPAAALNGEIERALRRMGEELDLDRATMVEADDAASAMRVTASWQRPGTEPVPILVARASFPWMRAQLTDRRIVRLSSPDELPADAVADRASLRIMGTRSVAAVPLTLEGAVVGALSFATVRAERQWPDDLVPRLRLLEEAFAHALARRRADSAIRESEERFTLMADSAPVMVWLADPGGRRTYVNARWLEFTGRRLEDETGDGWLAGVDPDDREACRDVLAAAVAERRPATLEYRLRGADGRSRWVLDHAVPRIAADGTSSGYVGTCIDVSELRAAQQAVAEGDALRSAIFGALYGNVVALDQKGVIIAVNRSWTDFARQNGVDPVAVSVGADYLAVCRAAAGMGDADGRQALEMITAALGGSPKASRMEYACPGPAGERWFEMSVEPLRRLEGGAVVSHVDITRQRDAEEAARRQAADLAHVQRVGTLGDLAATLAHEINQPLAAIVTNAQATIRQLGGAGPEAAALAPGLEDIAADAKRASQVIGRLRALFKKEKAARVPVPINGLVEQVVRLLDGELRERRIAVKTELDGSEPVVLGDPVQLQQIALNVFLNAIEAIAAAGSDPCEIRVASRRPAPDRVVLSIRDTGVGVPARDLERIFARFFTSKASGLGMGLPISRAIAEAHGGGMWATVDGERGLAMHVELPCETGAPRA